MKTTLIITLSMLFLFPSMAMAQNEWGPDAGDWELTLQGSGSSNNDFDYNDATIEAGIAYFLTRQLGLGLRQGGTWVDPPAGDDSWNGSSRLFIDFNFDLARLRPFIGVSGGYLYGENTDDRWIAGGEAGLKFYLLRKTFLYLLGEYDFTFESSDKIEDVYDDGRFVYALGFGINW